MEPCQLSYGPSLLPDGILRLCRDEQDRDVVVAGVGQCVVEQLRFTRKGVEGCHQVVRTVPLGVSHGDLPTWGALLQAGARQCDLAQQFGLNRKTVPLLLKRAGVTPRPRGLSEEQVEIAARLYATGRSLAAIGQVLERNPSTIRNALLARGFTLRPGQGGPKSGRGKAGTTREAD